MTKIQIAHLEKINKLLRYWILDMTTIAGSGHPTSSLSAVELMSTLMFSGVFRYNVQKIDDPCNDRMIFSKGHAAPLLYALWTAAGEISPSELRTLRKFGSRLEGHPTEKFPFTEIPTGSLGQGLSVGVGMALAQRELDGTQARTFVLLGDSEMAEGQNWEAMQIAQYYELGNLIAIVDVNRLGQRGETMNGHDTDVYVARARSFGWRVVVVDGHDIGQILRVYRDVIGAHKKPLMIVAKTFKGKGVSFLENKHSWHGRALTDHEFSDAIAELGDIDFGVRDTVSLPDLKKPTKRSVTKKVHKFTAPVYDLHEMHATRDAYGDALVQIMQDDEKIVVLDGEVSNSTRTQKAKEYFPERFFEMFIAEQNMVGVAVGLATRGYYPFVSSFAAFLIRAHDQIRMAQYAQVPMALVGSHAGVSVGEDGGSQMGLEDVAMMRAMIGSTVYCPADAVSTRAAVYAARQTSGIAYLRTLRDHTPVIYEKTKDLLVQGMCVVKKSRQDRIAIVGSGVTLHEALKAYKICVNEGNDAVRVIDIMRISPFDNALLRRMIGTIPHVIVVEDHFGPGGIGEIVAAALTGSRSRVISLCVRNMPCSGTAEELRAYEKIDFNAIMDEVKKIKKRYDR